MAADERGFRTCDLAFGRIGVAQLAHPFDDLEHSLNVSFRELTAGGIRRQRAA